MKKEERKIMAKNWLLSEVAVEFKKGTNKEAIMDIGKRFPLLADLMARAVSGDANAMVEIMKATPERLTAGIMHTKLKENVSDDDYEEEVDDISMDDDVSGNSDPRWDALKGLMENDNN